MGRQLTSWFDAYCEYCEDWEPPAIFNKWVGLSILGVATQRKVWFPDANNFIYPNLFVVLVGTSGVGKTTAMRESLPFLATLNTRISPAKITAAKFIQDLEANSILGPDGVPIAPYLIWSEEFPAFLGPQAYESGMIADLTTLYDCPTLFEKQTKTQTSESIHNPYVNILGGTTPQGIFDVLPPGTICQGFTARIIFVYSDYTKNPIAEKPWGKKQIDLQKALLADLESITALKGPVQLSSVAKVLWKDYYETRRFKDLEGSDNRLQGYLSRKPFYVRKIMMLLSIAESDSMIVEAHHLERAIQLLDELDTSVEQVYLQISPSLIINMQPRFLAVLNKAEGHIIDRASLQRRFAYALESDHFDRVIRALEQQELITLVEQKDPLVNRTKRYYKLTPKGVKDDSHKGNN